MPNESVGYWNRFLGDLGKLEPRTLILQLELPANENAAVLIQAGRRLKVVDDRERK